MLVCAGFVSQVRKTSALTSLFFELFSNLSQRLRVIHHQKVTAWAPRAVDASGRGNS